MPSPPTQTRSPSLRASSTEQIARFHGPYRRALRDIAQYDPRCADLLVSFPAACAALADRRGPAQMRGEAIWRIRQGAPLTDIAQALDIPPWTKKLPPETFISSIPAALGFSEPEPGLYGQFAKRAPHNPRLARRWFLLLRQCLPLGGFRLALWATSDPAALEPAKPRIPRALAAYAYFSNRPRSFGARFLNRPWDPKTPWPQALKEARSWLFSLVFGGLAAPHSATPAAVTPSDWRGHQIRPLIDPRDIRREGRVMGHCIGSYWIKVLAQRALLFRITAPDGECANVEFARDLGSATFRLSEMKGPGNAPVSRELQTAGRQFLHEVLSEPAEDCLITLRVDQRAWTRLWTPYWRDQDRAFAIPREPDHHDLVKLICELGA